MTLHSGKKGILRCGDTGNKCQDNVKDRNTTVQQHQHFTAARLQEHTTMAAGAAVQVT